MCLTKRKRGDSSPRRPLLGSRSSSSWPEHPERQSPGSCAGRTHTSPISDGPKLVHASHRQEFVPSPSSKVGGRKARAGRLRRGDTLGPFGNCGAKSPISQLISEMTTEFPKQFKAKARRARTAPAPCPAGPGAGTRGWRSAGPLPALGLRGALRPRGCSRTPFRCTSDARTHAGEDLTGSAAAVKPPSRP